MDCPHVDRSRIGGRTLLNKISTSVLTGTECRECSSRRNSWMCVHCGHIGCGRYVSGHAKSHYEDKKSHYLSMDVTSLGVYCYACDDYVMNDSRDGDLASIRSRLQAANEHENVSNSTRNTTSNVVPTRRGRKPKDSRNNSVSGAVVGGSESLTSGPHKHHHHHRRESSDPGTRKRRTKANSELDERLSEAKKRKRSCQANVAGLRNLGNTCFMNAVLQSLSNIPRFSEYFKEMPSLESRIKGASTTINPITTITPFVSSTRKSPSWNETLSNEENRALLAEELRKTLLLLWNGSKGQAISPESLFQVIWKVVPRYRGYQQQDAHEFLRYMLDRLHTELLDILPYPTDRNDRRKLVSFGKSTIVTGIFGGILQNEVTCLVCRNVSTKHDPFLDLSLDLPEVDCSTRSTDSVGGNSNDSSSNQGPPDKCHLFDCLSSFIRLEELEDTELYHCSVCKKKQKSTKRFWIRRLPNVLCLHLKRFRWSNYLRTKLETFVEYPIRGLDMSQYVLSSKHQTRRSANGATKYDLAAVVVHHGSGVGSGHYTAYATHGGCWHHFNDSNVTICEEDTVANSNAYILFYIRRELNLTPFTF